MRPSDGLFQVIITTYQTLNLEFVIKDPDVEEDEHLKWLQQYGYAPHVV